MFMVKIGKEYLSSDVCEEIMWMRVLWGIEVYMDDLDVIVVCIYGGWIRGEWYRDVNINFFNFD